MNTRTTLAVLIIGLMTLGLGLVGCGDAEETTTPAANSEGPNGKTDTPDGKAPAEEQCEKRERDNLNSAQQTYLPTAIRWACADVEGVNTVGGDSRGQEYCEYYAIVQPPPEAEGSEERPAPIDLGRNKTGGGTTDLGVELNDDQLFWLEDHANDVVGQCVFTSWHADVPGPVPACEAGGTCPEVMGFGIDEEHFRMKVSFNSNSAASALVNDCVAETLRPQNGKYIAGDPEDAADPLNRDFFRACMATARIYGTHWRRSDPAVCAAAMRLVECGCSIPGVTNIGQALVPPQPAANGDITLRGFPLGTWSGANQLPVGCRYTDIGDNSQTIVTCDLTGNDLLTSASDPKERCRTKYANDVVVHVPVPQGVITCDPDPNGQYTSNCGDMPWVVESQLSSGN